MLCFSKIYPSPCKSLLSWSLLSRAGHIINKYNKTVRMSDGGRYYGEKMKLGREMGYAMEGCCTFDRVVKEGLSG